jgi:predicted esterase YcpF (UPF0227 family)
METWEPISAAELEDLLSQQLTDCEPELVAVFETYKVAPFRAPIDRYGREESVFVVARKGDEVLYFEDVEDGFNFSPISPHGKILEHWCNQDELKHALRRWMPTS